MSTRTLRLLAALLAAVLLAASCGGDDDDEPATTTTSEAADDDEGTTTTSDGEDTTTTSEGTSDTTAGGGEGEEGAGGGEGGTVDGGPMIDDLAAIDDFCSLDAYANEMDDAIFADPGAGPPDPERQREMRAVVEALYVRAAQVAPAELRGDFAIVSEGFGQLFDLLEEFDYDSMAMFMAMESDPELAARLEAIEAPEYQQASDNIQAWVDANC